MVPFNTVVNSFKPARWAMVKTIVIRMARLMRSFGERNSARQRRRREKRGDAGASEKSREEEEDAEVVIDFLILLLFARVDRALRRREARHRRPGYWRNTS